MKKTTLRKVMTFLTLFILALGAINCSKKLGGEPGGDSGGGQSQPAGYGYGPLEMAIRGTPVPNGVEYGLWVYNATYQNFEMSAMGIHQFVSTGNRDYNRQKAHEMAKAAVYQNIRYKALPDTIEYICVMDKMKEIRSKLDAENFINDIQSTLPYVQVAGAAISTVYAPVGGAIIAVAEFLKTALPVVNSVFNLLGFFGDIEYPVAYSVAYVARYKINIDGLQIVGQGKKSELRAMIPDSYLNEEGKTVIPHNLKFYALPYYVMLHNGFFTYTSEEIEQRETPEYSWNTDNMKTAGTVRVLKDMNCQPVDIWTISCSYSNIQDVLAVKQVFGYSGYYPNTPVSMPMTFPYLSTSAYTNFDCYAYSCSPDQMYYFLDAPYDTVQQAGNTILSFKTHVFNNLPSNTVSNSIQFIDTSLLKGYPVMATQKVCHPASPEGCVSIDIDSNNPLFIGNPKTVTQNAVFGITGKISFKYQYSMLVKKISKLISKDSIHEVLAEIPLNLRDTTLFQEVYAFQRSVENGSVKIIIWKLNQAEGSWIKYSEQ